MTQIAFTYDGKTAPLTQGNRESVRNMVPRDRWCRNHRHHRDRPRVAGTVRRCSETYPLTGWKIGANLRRCCGLSEDRLKLEASELRWPGGHVHLTRKNP